MKTIEERAKEYAPGTSNSDSLFPTRISTLATIERRGYIAGATEQKAIDIDKACEWLKENASYYDCAAVRCPYREEDEIICDVRKNIVEDFRKAMEE